MDRKLEQVTIPVKRSFVGHGSPVMFTYHGVHEHAYWTAGEPVVAATDADGDVYLFSMETGVLLHILRNTTAFYASGYAATERSEGA